MRDFRSLDDSVFCSQVETISLKAMLEWKELITTVMDNSNFQQEYDFRMTIPKTLNENIALAIASWSFGELGFVIREEIREKYRNSLEDKMVLEPLLDYQGQCLLFLLETSLWHTRDFFGNLFNVKVLKRILVQVRWIRRPKPVSTQRKRGYHDKGSMNLFPRTAYNDAKFVDSTLEHLHLYQKREESEGSAKFIKGWFS